MAVARQQRVAERPFIEARIDAIDWRGITAELDGHGWAVLPKLLASAECHEITCLYEDDGQFRSTVVMARHGFGQGEYKVLHLSAS